MKKTLSLFLTVIFASAVVFAAPSKSIVPESIGKPRGMYENFDKKFNMYKDMLDLSEMQAEEIKAEDDKLAEKQKPSRVKIMQLRTENTEALAKKDYEIAKENIREIANLEVELKINVIDYMQEIVQILDDDQYKKLEGMIISAEFDKREKAKEKLKEQEKNKEKEAKKKEKEMKKNQK